MLLDFSPEMLPHPLACTGLFGPLCYYLLIGFHGEGRFRVVSVFDLIFLGQTPGRTSSGVVCCEAHVSHEVGEVSSVK